jgi:hypothetical protein
MRRSLLRKTRVRVFLWTFLLVYVVIILVTSFGLRRWEGSQRVTYYLPWKESAGLAISTGLATAIWTTATWKKD